MNRPTITDIQSPFRHNTKPVPEIRSMRHRLRDICKPEDLDYLITQLSIITTEPPPLQSQFLTKFLARYDPPPQYRDRIIREANRIARPPSQYRAAAAPSPPTSRPCAPSSHPPNSSLWFLTIHNLYTKIKISKILSTISS